MSHTNGTGTVEKLLIKRLKVSGLLSFGPKGIDLPMRGLNVLIGANGSGKSNLLEILALLRAAPTALPTPVMEMVGEWLWKGENVPSEAVIDAVVSNPNKKSDLRHVLIIREHGSRLEVADERSRGTIRTSVNRTFKTKK